MSGYREDFYIKDNIIGYTGFIMDSPTVYFYNSHSYEFGHITQNHVVKKNIGKELVRRGRDYMIFNCHTGDPCSHSLSILGNRPTNFTKQLLREINALARRSINNTAVEVYRGQIIHKSRSAFKIVKSNEDAKHLLFQSVAKYPNLKERFYKRISHVVGTSLR
ncbi:MAG: hypothetical protein PUP46_08390, partial [Endozoicomonas sp. (ex Botrylloides leachii)]|nr:hypothetical protein [Endozoicomonas sp. (ex Botrylloides leachii)]